MHRVPASSHDTAAYCLHHLNWMATAPQVNTQTQNTFSKQYPNHPIQQTVGYMKYNFSSDLLDGTKES